MLKKNYSLVHCTESLKRNDMEFVYGWQMNIIAESSEKKQHYPQLRYRAS